MAEACRVLGLKGFAILTEAEYEIVLRLERDAASSGFPKIA
ncbi:hypothetical protein [Sphingomonas sp. MMS24-J13]